jgi:hypothetical protein
MAPKRKNNVCNLTAVKTWTLTQLWFVTISDAGNLLSDDEENMCDPRWCVPQLKMEVKESG